MKKIVTIAIAGVLAIGLAGCQNVQKRDVGLVTGGVVGGVVGNAVTGGSAVGTGVGAVGGALVGSKIGESYDRKR